MEKKASLVGKHFTAGGAYHIEKKASTVLRFYQCVLLSLASVQPHISTFSRDIIQAYIQSDTELGHHVFITPPSELRLNADVVQEVVSPLYGVPERSLQ